MSSLAVHDVIGKRVLVTRESARGLAPAIEAAIGKARHTLELDFSYVDGMTPSFLDELLSVVQEVFASLEAGSFRVEIVHPPTNLSSKFAAIGRGRALTIVQSGGGWVVEPQRRTA